MPASNIERQRAIAIANLLNATKERTARTKAMANKQDDIFDPFHPITAAGGCTGQQPIIRRKKSRTPTQKARDQRELTTAGLKNDGKVVFNLNMFERASSSSQSAALTPPCSPKTTTTFTAHRSSSGDQSRLSSRDRREKDDRERRERELEHRRERQEFGVGVYQSRFHPETK